MPLPDRKVLPRRDRVRVASTIGADEATVRSFLLGRRRTTPIIARAIREAMVALGYSRFLPQVNDQHSGDAA